MKEVAFSPATLDVSPDKSLTLKFPKLTITVMSSKDGIFAEILEGTSRKTFKGKLTDNQREIDKAVTKVMKELGTIMKINHNK